MKRDVIFGTLLMLTIDAAGCWAVSSDAWDELQRTILSGVPQNASIPLAGVAIGAVGLLALGVTLRASGRSWTEIFH